jgi:thiol-disulfide isomerase/thioredoxin
MKGLSGQEEELGMAPISRTILAISALAAVSVAVGVSLRPGAGAPEAAPAVGGRPRALELYTPYCPSCRRMSGVVEEINERCAAAGVRIEGLDVSREENEELAESFGVRAVPTFLFFDGNGVETAKIGRAHV